MVKKLIEKMIETKIMQHRLKIIKVEQKEQDISNFYLLTEVLNVASIQRLHIIMLVIKASFPSLPSDSSRYSIFLSNLHRKNQSVAKFTSTPISTDLNDSVLQTSSSRHDQLFVLLRAKRLNANIPTSVGKKIKRQPSKFVKRSEVIRLRSSKIRNQQALHRSQTEKNYLKRVPNTFFLDQ